MCALRLDLGLQYEPNRLQICDLWCFVVVEDIDLYLMYLYYES